MANRTDAYKDKAVRTYVEQDLHEEIKEFADSNGMKESPAIRQLIKLGLSVVAKRQAA